MELGGGGGGINGVGGNALTEEQNSMAPEMRESLKWLERNAVFFALLLISFAWYHRSGEELVVVVACGLKAASGDTCIVSEIM